MANPGVGAILALMGQVAENEKRRRLMATQSLAQGITGFGQSLGRGIAAGKQKQHQAQMQDDSQQFKAGENVKHRESNAELQKTSQEGRDRRQKLDQAHQSKVQARSQGQALAMEDMRGERDKRRFHFQMAQQIGATQGHAAAQDYLVQQGILGASSTQDQSPVQSGDFGQIPDPDKPKETWAGNFQKAMPGLSRDSQESAESPKGRRRDKRPSRGRFIRGRVLSDTAIRNAANRGLKRLASSSARGVMGATPQDAILEIISNEIQSGAEPSSAVQAALERVLALPETQKWMESRKVVAPTSLTGGALGFTDNESGENIARFVTQLTGIAENEGVQGEFKTRGDLDGKFLNSLGESVGTLGGKKYPLFFEYSGIDKLSRMDPMLDRRALTMLAEQIAASLQKGQ